MGHEPADFWCGGQPRGDRECWFWVFWERAAEACVGSLDSGSVLQELVAGQNTRSCLALS